MVIAGLIAKGVSEGGLEGYTSPVNCQLVPYPFKEEEE